MKQVQIEPALGIDGLSAAFFGLRVGPGNHKRVVIEPVPGTVMGSCEHLCPNLV